MYTHPNKSGMSDPFYLTTYMYVTANLHRSQQVFASSLKFMSLHIPIQYLASFTDSRNAC